MNIDRFSRYLAYFFLGVIIVLIMAPAWADNGHGHDHGDGGDNAANSESVLENVIKDDSLALGLGFSYGMGDVDINEGKNCMGSEQKANVLWGRQDMALNAWCASLFYELNGKHTFAAKLRCSIPEIGDHYLTAAECVTDQDLTPPKVTSDERDAINQHVEIEEQHSEDLVAVQMQQVGIVERMDELFAQLNAPRAQPQIMQQAQQYTDEQAAAVWAALKGEDEDNE